MIEIILRLKIGFSVKILQMLCYEMNLRIIRTFVIHANRMSPLPMYGVST